MGHFHPNDCHEPWCNRFAQKVVANVDINVRASVVPCVAKGGVSLDVWHG